MVTFDGINKIIQVDNDVTQLEMGIVYSLWKLWIVESENNYNTRYLKAFTLVGGDPLFGGKSLGITYFLENGWRMRPAPQDHSLNVIGNVYTREEGDSPFIQVEGNHTVSIIMTVSNLTDAEIMESEFKDNLDYRGSVYIDIKSEHEGVLHPIGTQLMPVNNLTDALEIARRIGTRTLHITGEMVLDRNLMNYVLIGDGNYEQLTLTKLNSYGGYPERFETEMIDVPTFDENMNVTGFSQVPMRCYLGYEIPGVVTVDNYGNPLKTGPLPKSNFEIRPIQLNSFGCDALIDLNGYNIDGCRFENFVLTGYWDGWLAANRCKFINPMRCLGEFENSYMSGDITVMDGDRCNNSGLKVRYIDTDSSNFYMDKVNMFSAISCINLSGHYHLYGMHCKSAEFIADFDSGEFIIGDDCTSGNIRIRGVNVYKDNSDAYPDLYIEEQGVLNREMIARDVWRYDFRNLLTGKTGQTVDQETIDNMMANMILGMDIDIAEKVWAFDIRKILTVSDSMTEEEKENIINQIGYYIKNTLLTTGKFLALS